MMKPPAYQIELGSAANWYSMNRPLISAPESSEQTYNFIPPIFDVLQIHLIYYMYASPRHILNV